jgi:hypothetical protein
VARDLAKRQGSPRIGLPSQRALPRPARPTPIYEMGSSKIMVGHPLPLAEVLKRKPDQSTGNPDPGSTPLCCASFTPVLPH